MSASAGGTGSCLLYTSKSTLLKIIVGALKPDAGTILWNGKAVDGTFLSEHVGYVPQENPLFEDLTVKDNLELWYANDKASLQKDLEDGWLFYFGMHKIYKKPVKKLSGGMKKRLSICCALAGDPDVLVMDEPGAALDLMAKNEILRLIKNFTRKGKSVIKMCIRDRFGYVHLWCLPYVCGRR